MNRIAAMSFVFLAIAIPVYSLLGPSVILNMIFAPFSFFIALQFIKLLISDSGSSAREPSPKPGAPPEETKTHEKDSA